MSEEFDAEDPLGGDNQDVALLLGQTAAGADRARIRHQLICDFEFWVAYDPDITIYPGDQMFMLRVNDPNRNKNSSGRGNSNSKRGKLDSKSTNSKNGSKSNINNNSTNAWDTGGGLGSDEIENGDSVQATAWESYTDLVKSHERSDSDSDRPNDDTMEEKQGSGNNRGSLSEDKSKYNAIEATERAKRDISGKIWWYLDNQDSNIDNNVGGVGGNLHEHTQKQKQKLLKSKNHRKLRDFDKLWTNISVFLFCILIIVIFVFFDPAEYWWVLLAGVLLFILINVGLNQKYKSGYNEYYHNRMYQLMTLCSSLNEHQNQMYKECFFELLEKDTMSVVACCSSRQYQRKAMIRVTPAMYTNN